MQITEPMTMITDYLLTVITLGFALMIISTYPFVDNPGGWYLAISLIITGIGALLGGTSHGFKKMMSEQTDRLLWRSTTFTIGIAAFFFYLAAVVSSIRGERVQIILVLLGITQLVVYLGWMTVHDEFIYVIINYVISMIVVIGLKIYSYYTFDDTSSLWLIGGVAILFVASGIQAAGISIHDEYFNHNDLFHVIQIPGLYLVLRAAIAMASM